MQKPQMGSGSQRRSEVAGMMTVADGVWKTTEVVVAAAIEVEFGWQISGEMGARRKKSKTAAAARWWFSWK